MSYQVVLTAQAKADLMAIYQYIAIDLKSVQNADGQLSRLEKEILSLDEMPERYRAYDSKKWQGRNLRVMPIDNYLVFYIPSKEDHTVSIIRVMYGGRDIEQHL